MGILTCFPYFNDLGLTGLTRPYKTGLMGTSTRYYKTGLMYLTKTCKGASMVDEIFEIFENLEIF
jgi:hypothetical protein